MANLLKFSDLRKYMYLQEVPKTIVHIQVGQCTEQFLNMTRHISFYKC